MSDTVKYILPESELPKTGTTLLPIFQNRLLLFCIQVLENLWDLMI